MVESSLCPYCTYREFFIPSLSDTCAEFVYLFQDAVGDNPALAFIGRCPIAFPTTKSPKQHQQQNGNSCSIFCSDDSCTRACYLDSVGDKQCMVIRGLFKFPILGGSTSTWSVRVPFICFIPGSLALQNYVLPLVSATTAGSVFCYPRHPSCRCKQSVRRSFAESPISRKPREAQPE
jgi:hypothetical protein